MKKQDCDVREKKIQEFENICKQINEVDQRKDELNLRGADVIAMTTTGAAKQRRILANLKPKVVVIEEAAEVLEAHVVTSLTSSVEHLILIGDHKQLKPKPSVYQLAKRYHLDLSLFERMVNNGMKVYTLSTQHRMRPEISNVLRHIYPNLKDAAMVNDYPNVKGVDRNMFFVNHSHFESDNEEIKSVSNKHEASFLAALCEYLIQQGYDGSKITVISGYAGQTMVLKTKLREKYPSVRVTSIDNYQGEENEIIWISLVRSNKNEKLGFMKTENRICVALSRAKVGLFAIGNFDMFVKGSEIWTKVIADAKTAGCYGDKLPLHCANHIDKKVAVACAKDFQSCTLDCDFSFKCGHKCSRKCHVTEMDHEGYKCKMPCEKKPCGVAEHYCKNRCHFGRSCPPCEIGVKKIIPTCQHEQEVPCYVEPDDYYCQAKCENRLECGHPCSRKCHEECKERFCTELVEKSLSCGHTVKIECNRDPGPCQEKVSKVQECGHSIDIACSKEPKDCKTKIAKTLSCGHSVFIECFVPPGPCEEMVTKELPCKHSVWTQCSYTPQCFKKVWKFLKCGHRQRCPCCIEPGNCTEIVQKALPCGHDRKMRCSQDVNEIDDCTFPCKEELKCGHKCSGKCGECVKGRLHIKCRIKCERPLICSHLCGEPCTKNCPPCTEKCQNRCKHSRCAKTCGDECVPCKMECEWKCEHQVCERKCHELCDREPCNEPCGKILKCNHKCIGLCGEECPPLCRACDKDVVEEILFGEEDSPDARFVYLPDCKHIIEVNGLDRWMEISTDSHDGKSQIKMKDCPKCKTVIRKCLRYGNIIKTQWNDIAEIKRKVLDEGNQLQVMKERLEQKLKDSKSNLEKVQVTVPGRIGKRRTSASCSMYQWMEKMLTKIKSTHKAIEFENKLNLCSQISCLYESETRVFRRSECSLLNPKISGQVERVKSFVFNRFLNDEQQVSDAANEIRRLQLHTITQEAINKYETMTGQDDEKQKITNMDKKRLDEILDLLAKGTRIDNVDDYILEIKGIQKRGDINSKLTDQERVMIVKTMGFKKGHWFKCPNGHFYAIGECGGAMQTKCPECKAVIGGSNHRLIDGNYHAYEFDNSTAPAWSEAANMRNYDLNN